MRILRGLYHFLLFLIVSWTVYNTFLFVCLLLPASENEFAELTLLDDWNLYLLGALDFHKFIDQVYTIFKGWTEPCVLREYWPLLTYLFVVNGLAAFIWCNKQNPVTACFLALAPCIAGIYLGLVWRDGMILIYGIIGIVVFYTILYKFNNYRKKEFPNFTLPAWLEWRRPNMIPLLKPIVDKVEDMLNGRYK